MYDVIIIGAGPAGITAAIYLKRANKKILLIENNVPGSKLLDIKSIENFPSYDRIDGLSLATKLLDQINNLKIDLKIENVIGITNKLEVITNKSTYIANKIIIATGKSIKTLNLKNENRLVGNGISYCAICDGSFYKEKIVGVVGNNNKTLEDVKYLLNICKKIYLFTDKLKIDNEKVVIVNSKISKINGDTKLESVIADKEYKIDGLFIIDGISNEKYFLNNDIILDSGYIVVDKNYETNISGIFACGDCIKKDLYQIITAMADGAIVSLKVLKK